MKRKPEFATAALLAIAFALPAAATTQALEQDRLRDTIRQLDKSLFDAFNRCADSAELAKHASYFAPDTEFYHDNGGVTWTRAAMLANTEKYACGNYTRELLEDSFQVSPVKDFGAISTGVHRFCQNDTKQCDGEAEFAMVWRNTDGKWEVTRTLSFGHRPAQAARGIPAASVEAIREANQITSVSFALIANGALDFAAAAGDARSGVAATPATLYNIASLTKPISAEVALQLAAAGEISLDEDMSAFWTDPDLADDPRRHLLTPRIALAHQTGLPNWRQGRLAFGRDPGQGFDYSGEGYEYLANFLREKTSHPLDYWAQRLVFAPNGMRQTTYTQQPWLEGRIAFPHDADGKELTPQISRSAVASDNIFSSPSDYAQFVTSVMRAQQATGPLSADRSKVQTDRKHDLCKALPAEQCPALAGMAMGWELFVIHDVRYFMHTGSDDGTFTFAYFSPDTASGVVIFTNSSHGSKAVLPMLRLTGNDKDFVDFLEALVSGAGE